MHPTLFVAVQLVLFSASIVLSTPQLEPDPGSSDSATFATPTTTLSEPCLNLSPTPSTPTLPDIIIMSSVDLSTSEPLPSQLPPISIPTAVVQTTLPSRSPDETTNPSDATTDGELNGTATSPNPTGTAVETGESIPFGCDTQSVLLKVVVPLAVAFVVFSQ